VDDVLRAALGVGYDALERKSPDVDGEPLMAWMLDCLLGRRRRGDDYLPL